MSAINGRAKSDGEAIKAKGNKNSAIPVSEQMPKAVMKERTNNGAPTTMPTASPIQIDLEIEIIATVSGCSKSAHGKEDCCCD
jgi:hypothetical protein